MILAGGLALQCTGMQDQKKIWNAIGITSKFTSAQIIDTCAHNGYGLAVVYIPQKEARE